MRKLFALVLAVAMVLSLASVAFAATTVNNVAKVVLEGPFRYDADANTMKTAGEDHEVMRYGEGTYYLIKIQDGYSATGEAPDGEDAAPISAYKEVEKLKVKAEFEMGKDLVESISVVKKYVNAPSTSVFAAACADTPATTDDYYYFVEFKVAKKETTADADIIATLEFNRKADDDVDSTSDEVNSVADHKGIGKIKDDEVDVSFNVFYKNTWLNDARTDLEIKSDVEHLEFDTDYALKFKNDDEVELTFGHKNDGDNEGSFTVDVSGQGKVYLRYNTKADEAIAAANPGVKMFFLNFNNVKFNRVGEFVYEMDDIAAAYKVVDGQLVEIKGLDLDADSATFNTRVLESYVFADAELVNPAPAVVDAPAAAEVTNPTTGAAE